MNFYFGNVGEENHQLEINYQNDHNTDKGLLHRQDYLLIRHRKHTNLADSHQAEKSGILTDANLIRDNKNPITEVITSKKLVHGELQDMYYMFRDTRDSLHQLALKMFFSAVESDGVDNVGIAVPRREGCLNSAYELNKDIAEVLLKDEKKSISFGEKEFKLGCKVVQTVNDYDRNVFNGEIGYITFIGEDMSGKKPVTYCEVTYQSFGPKVEKDVGLVFDEDNNIVYEKQDKVIRYEGSELTDLDMAYALTTHKMQGSSRKTVICVIDNTHYKLLDNCMLYTMLDSLCTQKILWNTEKKRKKKHVQHNK